MLLPFMMTWSNLAFHTSAFLFHFNVSVSIKKAANPPKNPPKKIVENANPPLKPLTNPWLEVAAYAVGNHLTEEVGVFEIAQQS